MRDTPPLTQSNFIPLSVPEIRGNEWKYIKECLDTNWVSSAGPFVERFEQMVADYVGAKAAVATVNGTAALHIALLVAGIRPDDEVLVSCLSFIAPANAIRYIGAWPVFMDCEPNYWQMDVEKAEDFLTKECRSRRGMLYNKRTSRRVKAILPVHILGHPCDMQPILEIARKYNLAVVEDAAESLGAKYKDRRVGCLGDIGCLSFNGNKIITCGGGGMIVTNKEEWAHRSKYLTTQAKDDDVENIHNEIGFNYRLANIQAAMGCAQMERLDDHIAAKRHIAKNYHEALENKEGILLHREASWAFNIFWLYTVLIDRPTFGVDRRAVHNLLAREGIETRPLWQPLHRSRAYARCEAYRIENAARIYKNALSLPSSVGLSPSDIERIGRTLLSL